MTGVSPTRRTFLRAAAMTAAGSAAAAVTGAGPASGDPSRRIRRTREEHRVVIVGSGFGGGVAALRLAQAGVPVVPGLEGVDVDAAQLRQFPQARAEVVVAAYGGDSAFNQQARTMMNELTRAATAFGSLARTIERNPRAFILGR